MKFRDVYFYLKILIVSILLFVTTSSPGQNSNLLNVTPLNGSVENRARQGTDRLIEYVQDLYSAHVEAPKELINGKEYESYYTRSKSKPLLLPGKRRTATIFTKTRRYNKITLQYDSFLDEVVYTDIDRTINYRFPEIALNKDNIDGFNLYFEDDSMIFKNIRAAEASKWKLKEGFYEIAYAGLSDYIIRHASSYYVREGLNEYKYYTENLIRTGDKYVKVKNKRDLLMLFGDKGDLVNKYIRSSRIRVRQTNKDQFVSILKYYDGLTSGK